MTVPEFLDREKTFEVALADDDDGTGFAEVKMAPVGTRDPVAGDALMSGAFDSQKGAVIPVLPGHRTDRPPIGKVVYAGEKSGRFMGRLEFNDTTESQEWRKAAKTGVVQASVRYRAKMSDVEKAELGGGRLGFNVKKAVLRELSLTGLGAMPGTGLSRVKAEPATTTITIDGEKIAEAIRAGIHFEDPPKRAPGRDYGSPAPFTRSLAATDLSHRSL